MTSISQDPDSFGNWLYYGEDIYGDDGSISRSNTINNFDPIQYKNTYLTGFLDSLPDNKPKPKSKPKASSTSNTSAGTTNKTATTGVKGSTDATSATGATGTGGTQDDDAASFNHISIEDFDNISEENLVPMLQSMPEYDEFEFTETGSNRDKVKVTHKKSGKSKTIYLNTKHNRDRESGLKWDADEKYNEFIDFINENKTESSSEKSPNKAQDLIKKYSK